jgi:hypothetical protein
MRVHELTLSAIDAQRHLAASPEIVAAVAYAAGQGYGGATCYRFVTALVMTDQLRDRGDWRNVLLKIKDLQLDEQIAELEAGRPVVGNVEP